MKGSNVKKSITKILLMALIAGTIGGVLMSRYFDSNRQQQPRPVDNTYLYDATDMIDNQHYVGW